MPRAEAPIDVDFFYSPDVGKPDFVSDLAGKALSAPARKTPCTMAETVSAAHPSGTPPCSER
jgi:hypothetical protein